MMRYIIKILFSESMDFTAQYRYEYRSFHQCAILGYVYLNDYDQVHKRILLSESIGFTAQYRIEHR